MPDFELIIERQTIQPGRTVSFEALEAGANELIRWLTSELLDQWSATQVPPTRIVLTAQVQIQ